MTTIPFAEVAAALFPSRTHRSEVFFYAARPEAAVTLRWPASGAPVAILFHGGGWRSGGPDRDGPLALALGAAGWATASVRYRLTHEAPAPAAVEDAVAAVAATRDRGAALGLDTARVVLMGVSAGAHLAMVAGMMPQILGGPAQPPVSAVVNLYGITDVAALVRGPGERDFARLWLAAAPDPVALAWHLSPLRLATQGPLPPPLITVHGTRDVLVPIAQARALHDALASRGAVHELVEIDGTHGDFPPSALVAAFARVEAFLRRCGAWSD